MTARHQSRVHLHPQSLDTPSSVPHIFLRSAHLWLTGLFWWHTFILLCPRETALFLGGMTYVDRVLC